MKMLNKFRGNRLFIGIEIPDSLRQEIDVFRKKHEQLNGVKWVKLENLHITVSFFGKVPREMLPNLLEMIRVVLLETDPFELTIDGYALGPDSRNARMIWIKWKKNSQFKDLSQRIHRLYCQIDPSHQQRKSPVPHITIARFKDFERFDELKLQTPMYTTHIHVGF